MTHFSFYDAADLAPPEHEIELLWRIEGSLKNALTLLAELRPATRDAFPPVETGSYPEDREYDGELLTLGSMEKHLPAYALMIERAQKTHARARADTMCIGCLCGVFARCGGRPGARTVQAWNRRPRPAEDYSGLGITTLHTLAAAGKIKMVKVGGRTLAIRASIDDYLASLAPK
jgi:hypothetical protein